ncbi:MAG: hypothetical protein WBA88_16010 [Pseudaminobacter sp.]
MKKVDERTFEPLGRAARRLLEKLDERSRKASGGLGEPEQIQQSDRSDSSRSTVGQERRSSGGSRTPIAMNDNCGQVFTHKSCRFDGGTIPSRTHTACPPPGADTVSSDLRSRFGDGYGRGSEE